MSHLNFQIQKDALSNYKNANWDYLLNFQEVRGLLQQQDPPLTLGGAQHVPLNKKVKFFSNTLYQIYTEKHCQLVFGTAKCFYFFSFKECSSSFAIYGKKEIQYQKSMNKPGQKHFMHYQYSTSNISLQAKMLFRTHIAKEKVLNVNLKLQGDFILMFILMFWQYLFKNQADWGKK